jgi:hypothetical protein
MPQPTYGISQGALTGANTRGGRLLFRLGWSKLNSANKYNVVALQRTLRRAAAPAPFQSGRPQLDPFGWGRFFGARGAVLGRVSFSHGSTLGAAVAYMTVSPDYPTFIKTLDTHRPRFHDELELPFDYRPDEDDGKGL